MLIPQKDKRIVWMHQISVARKDDTLIVISMVCDFNFSKFSMKFSMKIKLRNSENIKT